MNHWQLKMRLRSRQVISKGTRELMDKAAARIEELEAKNGRLGSQNAELRNDIGGLWDEVKGCTRTADHYPIIDGMDLWHIEQDNDKPQVYVVKASTKQVYYKQEHRGFKGARASSVYGSEQRALQERKARVCPNCGEQMIRSDEHGLQCYNCYNNAVGEKNEND